MGPMGYAVAYRTLHRPDGALAGPSRPVRSRAGELARTILIALLVVLGLVASVDGDWWLGIPLVLVAVAFGATNLPGGAPDTTAPPGCAVGPDRPPRGV